MRGPSGTTTCRPLPLLVFNHASSPSAASLSHHALGGLFVPSRLKTCDTGLCRPLAPPHGVGRVHFAQAGDQCRPCSLSLVLANVEPVSLAIHRFQRDAFRI